MEHGHSVMVSSFNLDLNDSNVFDFFTSSGKEFQSFGPMHSVPRVGISWYINFAERFQNSFIVKIQTLVYAKMLNKAILGLSKVVGAPVKYLLCFFQKTEGQERGVSRQKMHFFQKIPHFHTDTDLFFRESCHFNGFLGLIGAKNIFIWRFWDKKS